MKKRRAKVDDEKNLAMALAYVILEKEIDRVDIFKDVYIRRRVTPPLVSVLAEQTVVNMKRHARGVVAGDEMKIFAKELKAKKQKDNS